MSETVIQGSPIDPVEEFRSWPPPQYETLGEFDDIINEATITPPQTTRARMRGAFVKRANERNRDFTVDWVHLKLNDQLQRTLMLKDPFKSHDDRFDRLLHSL